MKHRLQTSVTDTPFIVIGNPFDRLSPLDQLSMLTIRQESEWSSIEDCTYQQLKD